MNKNQVTPEVEAVRQIRLTAADVGMETARRLEAANHKYSAEYIYMAVAQDAARAAVEAILSTKESDLRADNERLLAIMRRVEPYLDAIICYASTMGEHEPNRIVADFRAALQGSAS